MTEIKSTRVLTNIDSIKKIARCRCCGDHIRCNTCGEFVYEPVVIIPQVIYKPSKKFPDKCYWTIYYMDTPCVSGYSDNFQLAWKQSRQTLHKLFALITDQSKFAKLAVYTARKARLREVFEKYPVEAISVTDFIRAHSVDTILPSTWTTVPALNSFDNKILCDCAKEIIEWCVSDGGPTTWTPQLRTLYYRTKKKLQRAGEILDELTEDWEDLAMNVFESFEDLERIANG